MTGRGNLAERANDVGLGLEIHRQVRLFPATEHTHALKAGALHIDLAVRVFTAFGAKGLKVDLVAGPADHRFYLVLDGQTVTVPAGHIGCIVAVKTLRFNDDIFENFIDRMTDVQGSVRIRRTIMQNKLRATQACRANLLVNAIGFPVCQHYRFAFGQITAHRKIRLR